MIEFMARILIVLSVVAVSLDGLDSSRFDLWHHVSKVRKRYKDGSIEFDELMKKAHQDQIEIKKFEKKVNVCMERLRKDVNCNNSDSYEARCNELQRQYQEAKTLNDKIVVVINQRQKEFAKLKREFEDIAGSDST